jgi:hypothetical protein
MDLIIYDVPEDDNVIAEIKQNSMTTIGNFKRNLVPMSAEAIAVEAEIAVIKGKNIEAKPVAIEEKIL